MPARLIGKLRIFIVEDNDENLRLLTRHFQAAGHFVTTACGAFDAELKYPGYQWHVLICNIQLYDGDGLILMRKLDPASSVFSVVLSASDSPQDRKKVAAFGVHKLMMQPIEPDAMEELLRSAMIHRLRQLT